jgi:hypothetical protein
MRFNVPCYVQRDNASQRKLTSRRADKISETHSRACRKGSRDPNAAIVGILSMKIHYMSASRSASRRIVEMLLWNLNWYGRSGDRKSYAPLTIHKLISWFVFWLNQLLWKFWKDSDITFVLNDYRFINPGPRIYIIQSYHIQYIVHLALTPVFLSLVCHAFFFNFWFRCLLTFVSDSSSRKGMWCVLFGCLIVLCMDCALILSIKIRNSSSNCVLPCN